MEVGDYVRFDYHRVSTPIQIAKIIETHYDSEDDSICYLTDVGLVIDESNLVKEPSENPIDLIEEHDLVVIEYYSLRYKERVTRLFEVDYKDKEFMTIKNAYCDFMLRNNEFNDEDKKLKPIIKSIVTKEQFESMEYKIESVIGE